jgi:hypothetical protein
MDVGYVAPALIETLIKDAYATDAALVQKVRAAYSRQMRAAAEIKALGLTISCEPLFRADE